MKKTLPQIQYSRLSSLFHKLNARLNRHFNLGRFYQLSKAKQSRLIKRLLKIQAQLQRLERGMKLAGSALVVGAALCGTSAQAQFAADGSEFLVNTFTTNGQNAPSVARDNSGNFVVVWTSPLQDGSMDGVYAQRYNASGVAQGSEFRVNTTTTFSQRFPQVAMDADGDFVVAWQGRDFYGAADIYLQRYLSDGTAEGTEVRVNTYTTGSQLSPAVAMDVDGDFVVTWYDNSGQDGDGSGIYAQRYTGGFPITTGTMSSQALSALQLFPNPAQDDVFVSLEGEAGIRILGLSGQLIEQTQTAQQRFSVAGLPAGVYLIEITQGEAKAMKKLVVR